MTSFNSAQWFDHLEILANTYYEKSQKQFIDYDPKRISHIKEIYAERLVGIKTYIYGEDGISDNRIDQHKITALYVQLFLENPVFVLSIPQNPPYPTWDTILINEIFCLDITRIILTDWGGKVLDIDKFSEYKPHFLKMLYNYKDTCVFHKHNITYTCIFAHVIYFIEHCFCVYK